MLNIKKVRLIRSAAIGAPLLSSNLPFDWATAIKEYVNSKLPMNSATVPLLNPFMTADGFPYPKPPQTQLPNKPVGSIAKSTDITNVQLLSNEVGKINFPSTTPKLFNTGNLNLGLELLNNSLFSNENNSNLTSNINAGWNTTASTIGAINPALGAAMLGIGIISGGINSLGGKTDLITTTDLILGSTPGTIATLGLNGFLGKRTLDFSVNKLTMELIGGSYSGSVNDINDAASKARKKYGLLSSGSRKRANNQINIAKGLLNTMTNIANEASDMVASASNMSNHLNYNFNLNGGYDQRYMRSAKIGGKLERIKKLNLSKFKVGGIINSTVNLDTKEIEWIPVITEPIEIYEDGGKIKKPAFEDWYNSLLNKDLNYDYLKAYEQFDTALLINHAKDPENYHLNSISIKADNLGRFPFSKLGKIEDNPEILGEFDWYNSEEGKEQKSKYDIIYDTDRYYYIPKKFKEGGKAPKIEETSQKNVIPEGTLHARKHHMENIEGITKKGIPVIDNDKEQLAEIELNEIIFTLEVTKKLEELLKDGSDDAAIEAGKLLVELILFNTDDRTGLIGTLKLGGVIQAKNE